MAIEVWGHYLAARALDGVRTIDRLDRAAVREAKRAMRKFRAGRAVNARGLALWAFVTESPYEAATILDDEQRQRVQGWEVWDGAVNDLCAARVLAESDPDVARERAARGRAALSRIGAVVPAWLSRLPAEAPAQKAALKKERAS
jgi:hypothetical protein